MAEFVTVEITGLKGIEDALSEAGPKLARRALRKALTAGGEVFVNAVKARCPVMQKDTPQRHPGELRDSIAMKVSLNAKQEAGVVRVGSERKKDIGSQSPAVWGKFVEFGSIHNHPTPYLRPGFDTSKDAAQEAFTEVLKDAVETLGEK